MKVGSTSTVDVSKLHIVGSGSIYGTVGGVPTPDAGVINSAIAATGARLDPYVLATGTTGINVFVNGIDTRTRGADLSFDMPVNYAIGCSIASRPTTTALFSCGHGWIAGRHSVFHYQELLRCFMAFFHHGFPLADSAPHGFLDTPNAISGRVYSGR